MDRDIPTFGPLIADAIDNAADVARADVAAGDDLRKTATSTKEPR